MFAGVTSSSRATCPNTEMRRRDRRWDSEVRPDRCSTSSFRTRSYHRIPSSRLGHFWWKASRVLTSADSKVHVSAAYSNTDTTSVWYIRSLVTSVRRLSLHIRFGDAMTAQARQGRYGVLGLDDIDHPTTVNCRGKQSCRLIRQYYRQLRYLLV